MENLRKGCLLKKIILISGLALGIYSLYFYKSNYKSNITEYAPSRDRDFILNIFKDNWYWLVAGYTDDFSHDFAAYRLDNKTYDSNPANWGKLDIKVYSENNDPKGFVAYYLKKLNIGKILFVAVDKKYRGKGYAEKLVNYAIADLKKKGSRVIRLLTRTDNKASRSLYNKLKFTETANDGQFVYFEKILD